MTRSVLLRRRRGVKGPLKSNAGYGPPIPSTSTQSSINMTTGSPHAGWPGTAAAYLSFVDQDGLAAMPRNAARLSLPFLYVIGKADPLYAYGRSYIFDHARAQGKSRYVEIEAGHLDTPDKAKSDFISWLKSLGS